MIPIDPDTSLRDKIKDLERTIIDAKDHLLRCRNELNAGKELPKPGTKWVNIKHGTTYTVESVGFHSETSEQLIAYSREGKTHYRPVHMWHEKFRSVES